MNSNPCPEYAFDLAAAAGTLDGLKPHTVEHLQTCPACRAAFTEFNEAALAHQQMASDLPSPLMRSGARTRPWAEERSTRRRTRLTPASWFALGTAVLALMVFGSFRSTKNPGTPDRAAINPKSDQPPKIPTTASYTWANLRQEVTAENSRALAEFPAGVPLAQYRLKDAYLETN